MVLEVEAVKTRAGARESGLDPIQRKALEKFPDVFEAAIDLILRDFEWIRFFRILGVKESVAAWYVRAPFFYI